MNKINNFIKKNLEKLLTIFIFIQPILDVATAISIKKFNINLTIGSIIRMLFLILCIYYLIVLNKKYKKKNILFLLIISVYFIIFSLITIKFKDFNALFYELKNTLNTFYLPITLISLLEMVKENNIYWKLKHIIYVYVIYLILIIIPTITNTGFLSYSHSKVGTIGWFLSANAIGNILSFLLPIILYYFIKISKNWLIKIIMAISILYIFTNIGTKVPILSIAIILLINIIYCFVKNIKNKNFKILKIYLIGIIVTVFLAFILVPKTSFYKNLEIHRKYLGIKYTEIFTNYDNINNFIFSERLTFLKNTHNNYKKASALEKIFGIGYIENYNTERMSTKTIEMDYFEIFYRHGIVGCLIFFAVFIKVLICSLKKILSNMNFLNIQYLSSIILILLLSLFSGHILVTPSVSIYISLIFSTLLYGFLEKKENC